jgi:hypothetical protein
MLTNRNRVKRAEHLAAAPEAVARSLGGTHLATRVELLGGGRIDCDPAPGAT